MHAAVKILIVFQFSCLFWAFKVNVRRFWSWTGYIFLLFLTDHKFLQLGYLNVVVGIFNSFKA